MAEVAPEAASPKSLIRVSWTGNGPVEKISMLPITAQPGEGRAVVVSWGRSNNAETSLPDLEPGDELEVGVELEVTTDLTVKEAEENARDGGKPTGRPYDFAPTVVVDLLLTGDADAAGPGDGKAMRIGDSERLKLSHDQHHGLFVFSRKLRVPREGLPWRSETRVNLVASASHAEAKPGQVLLVGQNEFDGSVETDMTALCAIRFRPAGGEVPQAQSERELQVKALPIDESEWKVVTAMRLGDLRKNEQMLARAELKTSTKSCGSIGRVKTRLFLADKPEQREPDGKSHAASVSSSTGHLTKANGSNCLPDSREQTFRKIGVLQIKRDVERPVYLNLAVQTGNPKKRPDPGDLAVVAAELSVTRFDPKHAG